MTRPLEPLITAILAEAAKVADAAVTPAHPLGISLPTAISKIIMSLSASDLAARYGHLAETSEAKRLRAILADAGAMRDAAGRVSEWLYTEARHLESPRIQGLRQAMVAYDRHMQPKEQPHD